MDKVLEVTLLYDFYGELLTQKQREAVELYYFNDYSLNEIGSRCGITRQAVHELIKRSEAILSGYEQRLGLVSRFITQRERLTEALQRFDRLLEQKQLSNDKDFANFRQTIGHVVD